MTIVIWHVISHFHNMSPPQRRDEYYSTQNNAEKNKMRRSFLLINHISVKKNIWNQEMFSQMNKRCSNKVFFSNVHFLGYFL